MTAVTVDALVVGAGIAGLSAAAELARDRRVLVVERFEHIATQTTGRSAAQFIAGYGSPAIRPFTEASRAWFAEGGGDADRTLLSTRGMLVVAEQPDGLDGDTAGERIDPAEARRLCGVLRADRIGAAAYDADALDIDVAEAVACFRRAARRRGTELRLGDTFVRGCRSGGHWQVETSSATVRCDTIVDAAGAWADDVARACGVEPIGARPLRRSACTFRHSAGGHEQWPLVSSAAHDWYFKPEPGLVMASPADETPSAACDPRPDEIDIARCLDSIREFTTLEPRSITTSWAGLRTFAPDRGLVLGPDPDEPSFVWCAGQGGFGIQTAPAAARTLGSLVRSGRLPDDIESRLPAHQVTAHRLRPRRHA